MDTPDDDQLLVPRGTLQQSLHGREAGPREDVATSIDPGLRTDDIAVNLRYDVHQ